MQPYRAYHMYMQSFNLNLPKTNVNDAWNYVKYMYMASAFYQTVSSSLASVKNTGLHSSQSLQSNSTASHTNAPR